MNLKGHFHFCDENHSIKTLQKYEKQEKGIKRHEGPIVIDFVSRK